MHLGHTCWLGAALCILPLPAVYAAKPEVGADGWYRWEVPAGPQGRDACCYQFRSGKIYGMGCTLSNGGDNWMIKDQADLTSDSMQVYVAVRDGKVRDIHPLSSHCPISQKDEVSTLDNVSSAESISWLRNLIEKQPKIAEKAIMTLSFHREAEAVPALIGILEDKQQDQDNREQALFWMAHSDSDLAYAYLEQLLNP